MDLILKIVVGVLAGILSSMGLGAGTVLILYLMLFTQTEQIVAQGMNLLFFLPIASLSIYLHMKNKLIEQKKTSYKISGIGVIGALAGCFAANSLAGNYLTKAFAVFLFLLGIKDLFAKRPKEDDCSNTQKPASGKA